MIIPCREVVLDANIPSRVKRASSVHIMSCKKSSISVCWCYGHSQNCIRRGRSSGNRGALSSGTDATDRHEVLLRGISTVIIRIPVLYRASSLPTAATVMSSLDDVRTVRGRPAFTRAVALPVSSRPSSNRLNTLAFGCRRPGPVLDYCR
jgi:hypothetical protein